MKCCILFKFSLSPISITNTNLFGSRKVVHLECHDGWVVAPLAFINAERLAGISVADEYRLVYFALLFEL